MQYGNQISTCDTLADITKITSTRSSLKTNKLIVYTAIFGGADILKVPQDPRMDVRYICFTEKERESRRWQQIIVPAWNNPRLQARYFKMHPWKFFRDWQMTLWIDGTFQLKQAPVKRFEKYMRQYDIVALQHPFRDDIYAEADVIARIHPGHSKEALFQQYKHYVKKGFDSQKILTSTGFLLRRVSQKLTKFESAWYNELIKWNCLRDQMSVDYMAWRFNINIGYIGGHYRNNRYVNFYGHGRTEPSYKMRWSRGRKEDIKYLW